VSADWEYVALDVETQGAGQILQIAGVKVPASGRGSEAFALWLNANPLALRAHQNAARGAEIVNCETLEALMEHLWERVGGRPWVVWSAEEGFHGLADQLAVLQPLLQARLEEVVLWELRELACLVAPEFGDQPLESLGRALGLRWERVETFPRGLGRASALALLMARLSERLGHLPLPLVKTVAHFLAQADHPWAPFWEKAAHRNQAPADRSLPELFLGRFQQLKQASRDAGEEGEESRRPQPLPLDLIQAQLSPGGPIAAAHPDYEHRPGQVEMALAVAEAFNEEGLLLVEAGTGTGKSMAYLVPALYWATTNRQKVVISTNTKNLQDQLYRKDLPFLREALGLEFTADLVKGRQNYLCLEKLLGEYEDVGFTVFTEDLPVLAYLLCWAWRTEEGDLDELSGWMTRKYPRLRAYAQALASDSDTCLSPARRGHACFAGLSRRRAERADLLIINHALALANATTQVLPSFAHLIFDEAHHLEDIATQTLGRELSRQSILRELRQLQGYGRQRGLLNRLRRALRDVADEVVRRLEKPLNDLEYQLSPLEERLDRFTEQLGRVAGELLPPPQSHWTTVQRLRLQPQLWEQSVAAEWKVARDNLRLALIDFTRRLTTLQQEVWGCAEALEHGNRLVADVEEARNHWTEIGQTFELIMKLDDPAFVYWLEVVLHREQLEWQLRAAPIHTGPELAAQVYRSLKTVILTSATLTVNGEFDYFRDRLGLTAEAARLRELQVPSTFRYADQVLLGIPSDMPLPTEANFNDNVAGALYDLIKLIQGRTLVLFTNYIALKQVYQMIAPALEEAGIETLAQGISGSRHHMAERFRNNVASVLLGTRSFWEGIDVPGEALQCVVIVKLPFAVPDDPIVQARCEHLEAQGINSRQAYYEPQAIVQFKQGFGRLIRSATDRGAVLVFDRRLLTKAYGQRFLNSVPGYTFLVAPWKELVTKTRWWLAGREVSQGSTVA